MHTWQPHAGVHASSSLSRVLLIAPHALVLLQQLGQRFAGTPAMVACFNHALRLMRVAAVNAEAEAAVNGGNGHGGPAWRWSLDASLMPDAHGRHRVVLLLQTQHRHTGSWMAVCEAAVELAACCLATGSLEQDPSLAAEDGASRNAATLLLLQLIDPSCQPHMHTAELHAALMLVGRVATLRNADVQYVCHRCVCRNTADCIYRFRLLAVVTELLLEALAAPTTTLQPATYGVVVHALRFLAIASIDADDSLSRKVLRTLLRLYKTPSAPVACVLLTGADCHGVLTDTLCSVAAALAPDDARRDEFRYVL